MENDTSPVQEWGAGMGPRVCIKGITLSVLPKTLEFLGFLEARLWQTAAEPVGTLVAAEKSYG